jgi:predicted kinase
MKTLYMTKGLPASGKTSAAKALVATLPDTKRVNKDDLRVMLDAGKWSRRNEEFVLAVRDQIVADALRRGFHIIVDDTNLAPKHEERLKQLAKAGQAKFELLDYTHVAPELCIERDLARPVSVGQKVILDMWEKYLKPEPQLPPHHDSALPNCILVDIDGTIAQMQGRGPFEWGRVKEDAPRPHVIAAVKGMETACTAHIIVVSGRDGYCFGSTQDWLEKHLGWYSKLFMRPAGDMRRDSVVKREIYEQEIKGKYNVVAIFDDRPQVIRECWQELGFGDRIFNVGTGKEF